MRVYGRLTCQFTVVSGSIGIVALEIVSQFFLDTMFKLVKMDLKTGVWEGTTIDLTSLLRNFVFSLW
jgi:hypothetical protein